MAKRVQPLRPSTELTGRSHRHTTRTAAMSSMAGLAARVTHPAREALRRAPSRTISPERAITVPAGDSGPEHTSRPVTSSGDPEGFAAQVAVSVVAADGVCQAVCRTPASSVAGRLKTPVR
jgi:hypothetical protein